MKNWIKLVEVIIIVDSLVYETLVNYYQSLSFRTSEEMWSNKGNVCCSAWTYRKCRQGAHLPSLGPVSIGWLLMTSLCQTGAYRLSRLIGTKLYFLVIVIEAQKSAKNFSRVVTWKWNDDKGKLANLENGHVLCCISMLHLVSGINSRLLFVSLIPVSRILTHLGLWMVLLQSL